MEPATASQATSDSTVRLRMNRITKHFGGIHALENVSIEARAGQVHSICGENGAGKSTLMKILAGAITDHSGEIVLDGKPVRFNQPRDAEDAGIRIIYQELNLIPELSVAANIFLGREPLRGGVWLSDRAMEKRAGELFKRLDAPIRPSAKVGDLRIGDQQMVEIAKALAFDAAILIMDEPTSALSDAEVHRLFRVIRELRASGSTVLYISHKMNEVFALSDWVTVLRDGRFAASEPRERSTPAQVVRWMVGREIAAPEVAPPPADSAKALEIEKLSLHAPPGSGRPSLRGINLSVRKGEVVGIAGLLGAGRTELFEAIFGASADRPEGTIRVDGVVARFRSPEDAIKAGVALVTEDRKYLGIFDQMTVGENITVRRLIDLTRLGLIDGQAERRAVAGSIARLSIKTAGGKAAITSLSGGNQQKCILARWLLVNPKVLLLDEPTRGIDIGAKAEIHALMRRLAGEGMAILAASSELPELLAVCDRILVLCEGRLTAEFARAEAGEEAIMEAATRFLDRGLTAASA